MIDNGSLSFNIIEVFFLIFAFNGICFAAALRLKSAAFQSANRVMALVVLLLALVLIDSVLFVQQFYQQYPVLYGWVLPLYPLIPLLIDRYGSIACDEPEPFSLKRYVPFFCGLILLGALLALDPSDKINLTKGVIAEEPSVLLIGVGFNLLIVDLMVIVQTLYYIVKGWKRVNRYQHKLVENFSNIEKRQMIWLKNMLIAFMFLWLVFVVEMVLVLVDDNIQSHIVNLGISVAIFGLGYFTLCHNQVFFHEDGCSEDSKRIDQDVRREISQDSTKSDTPKYKHSALDETLSSAIAEQIKATLNESQLYTDPDLDLSKLAERTGFSRNQLSQVLNDALNSNFYNFINTLRVEEAQRQLKSSPELTVLEIALNVGFNSKSSFYNAFKKTTGVTPTSYRASCLH